MLAWWLKDKFRNWLEAGFLIDIPPQAESTTKVKSVTGSAFPAVSTDSYHGKSKIAHAILRRQVGNRGYLICTDFWNTIWPQLLRFFGLLLRIFFFVGVWLSYNLLQVGRQVIFWYIWGEFIFGDIQLNTSSIRCIAGEVISLQSLDHRLIRNTHLAENIIRLYKQLRSIEVCNGQR